MTAAVFAYGVALWLGLYLIRRDPRSPRLLLTGLGLLSYALAVACYLISVAMTDPPSILVTALDPLLLLPAIAWTGTLVYLLPEDAPSRTRLVWPLLALAVFVPLLGGVTEVGRFVLGVLVLAPMLVVGGVVGWSSRAGTDFKVAGPLVVFTLFFALSVALILVPSEIVPRAWAMPLVGFDLILLGLAIAYFDAFDLGEALLPHMVRSLDAAAIAALVFCGQVALVIIFSTGPTLPMLLLLLGTVTSAVAATTLADPFGAALDRLALGRLPRVREARSELRATSSALARANPNLNPTKLDEADFTRLTRRALSSFGDLPRLSASPLVNLPLIEARLAARAAPDDPLERAAELKAVLAESIARLKPRTDAAFGTSDEWRHYNALHFPYVVGLKPYSARNRTRPTDPAAREALEWFGARVPERTLHNWQNAAARLVARDLLARGESFPQ